MAKVIKNNNIDELKTKWCMETLCIGNDPYSRVEIANYGCFGLICLNGHDIFRSIYKVRSKLDKTATYGPNYVVKCPECGCYTIIDEDRVPEFVKITCKTETNYMEV